MARKFRTVVFASCLLLTLLAPRPASAAAPRLVDLTCLFSATINFNPGLTLSSQSVQISGSVAAGSSMSPKLPCFSVTGVRYTGASAPVSGTGTLGCVTTGASASVKGTLPVTWNNGDTSTITWSVTVGGPLPTVSAKVTSGQLNGTSIVVLPLPTRLDGSCLTPLKSVSFIGVLTFLGL